MAGPLGATLLWEGEGEIQADIWFVHGLRGDSIKTWTKGNTYWPKDLLKNDIRQSRIFTWGYDSSVLKATRHSSQASIFGHSENLLNDVADFRDEHLTRPVIFVCHSLGGLVVKEALIRSSELFHNKQDRDIGAIYTSCKGVVFLGTPHRGSSKTSLGDLAAHVAHFALQNPNEKLISVLKENSDVLERQRRSFSTIANDIPLACIHEEMPTTLGLMKSNHSGEPAQPRAPPSRQRKYTLTFSQIVPEHSASIDGRNVRTSSIPADHMGMCRFTDKNDAGYRRVSRFIRSFVREAGEATTEGERATTSGSVRQLPAPETRTSSSMWVPERMDYTIDVEEAQ